MQILVARDRARAAREGELSARKRYGSTTALALLFGLLPIEESRAQDAEAVELPPVEITVTPPPTKYPVTTAVKKRPASSGGGAPARQAQVQAPTGGAGTGTEAGATEFPAETGIPGIVIVGDIIRPGLVANGRSTDRVRSCRPPSSTPAMCSHRRGAAQGHRVNVRDEEGFVCA
jgi:hypothetical protein